MKTMAKKVYTVRQTILKLMDCDPDAVVLIQEDAAALGTPLVSINPHGIYDVEARTEDVAHGGDKEQEPAVVLLKENV